MMTMFYSWVRIATFPQRFRFGHTLWNNWDNNSLRSERRVLLLDSYISRLAEHTSNANKIDDSSIFCLPYLLVGIFQT